MREDKNIKFYYSEPLAICNLPAVLDRSGNIMYVTDKKSAVIKKLPRITVASVYDPIANTMRFGVAVCSPEDTFVKQFGRDLAVSRALETPKATVIGIRRGKIRETSKKHANAIINTYLSKYVSTDF